MFVVLKESTTEAVALKQFLDSSDASCEVDPVGQGIELDTTW